MNKNIKLKDVQMAKPVEPKLRPVESPYEVQLVSLGNMIRDCRDKKVPLIDIAREVAEAVQTEELKSLVKYLVIYKN